MALILLDSMSTFDASSEANGRLNTQMWLRWSSGTAGPDLNNVHPLTGRFLSEASTNIYAGYQLPDRMTSIVLGFRFRIDETPNLIPFLPVMIFGLIDVDGITSGNAEWQQSVYLNGNQEFVLYAGDSANDEIDRVRADIHLDRRWHYIEYKTTIDASAGSYELRLDGVNIMSGSTVDTQFTVNAWATNLELYPEAAVEFQFADLYVLDTTGGSPWNDFLGDIHIEVLDPDGDGNRNDFTQLSGLTNYEMVDEAEQDEETSYVSSATALDDDLYTFSNLVSNFTTVYGVQVKMLGRNEDAGRRDISALCRSSTSESNGDVTHFNQDRYRMVSGIFEQNPNGPANWSDTTIDAAEFGITLET